MSRLHNYAEIYKNSPSTKKPYQYRDQQFKGHMKYEHDIGQRIAVYLDVNQISASAFAKRCTAYAKTCGNATVLSPSCVLHYVRNVCKPKSDKRELIMRYMGVSEAWLTGYQDVNNNNFPNKAKYAKVFATVSKQPSSNEDGDNNAA